MATRRYRAKQLKQIPKHKKAKLRKNRRGFRRAEFDQAWYKLIMECYDLPPRRAR